MECPYTCRTNDIEISAGNDHREEQFMGVYTAPPDVNLIPKTATTKYSGREGFSVAVNNVGFTSLLCTWWTKGGPAGGAGGYVTGHCQVEGMKCIPPEELPR
jgi:hypothetical protein